MPRQPVGLPAHVENAVDLAIRTALGRSAVAHITMPVDMQSLKLLSDTRSERNIPEHVSFVPAHSTRVPGEDKLARAAAILNAGSKIAILAGRGALSAREDLAAVAERLAAPVATALLGKGALPDEHPHATGGVDLLGTRPSQDALESCDTL